MIKSHEEWVASTREVSLLPKSPIEQKDGKWNVVQRKEAWEALGPRIFDDDLDRFRKVAVVALRERDPQFELEPEQRFAASLYGKAPKYSNELRKGVAETIALLGSLPQYLTSASHGKAEATAALAVRETLGDADWVLWASVNSHLPMLAEGAPDQFLDTVEKAAAQTPPPFVEIYAQENSGVMGWNYMTGLLWALETLAWHPDFLTRVIVLLGDLAVMDPGGNWSNRPANSLTEILLPWHPQTCADIPKRKTAVATLLHEHPTIGWSLLLSLLPKTHSVASGTRKPTWRTFISQGCAEKVKNQEYWEQVKNYAELAIDIAAADLQKLTELIQHLPNLPEPAHSRLLEILTSKSTTELSESERRPVWDALVSVAAKHRKFASAEWAMPTEVVTKIEHAASKLAPASPSLLHSRLFAGRDFDLFEEKGDFEDQRRKLQKKRENAVSEIIDASGFDEILQFARSVTSPWEVGFALGVISTWEVDASVLPTLLLSPEVKLEHFSAGFVCGRFKTKGWEWVDKVNAHDWDREQKAKFLSQLPFNRQTWERGSKLLGADESAYWARINPNPYEADEKDLIFAAERLLTYERPRAAIQCLERLVLEKKDIPVDLVIKALRANLASNETIQDLDQYATLELIKWLQENPNTPTEELFRIEWIYLPWLDRYSGGSPKTLMKRLAQDGSFFCEVIRTVFRAKGEEPPKEEPPEERKRLAEGGYRLLREWSLPPGCDGKGHIDNVAFDEWLSAVKQSTKESGHFEVAMSQFGQVLPYSPPDPDGLWIHKVVADALNAKDADAMRSGFTCELFNMRGAHWSTGGKEEKETAAGYREKAEAVENAGYHRLATSLREVAAWYEGEAEREEKRGPLG
jgi:hypothetical protein